MKLTSFCCFIFSFGGAIESFVICSQHVLYYVVFALSLNVIVPGFENLIKIYNIKTKIFLSVWGFHCCLFFANTKKQYF